MLWLTVLSCASLPVRLPSSPPTATFAPSHLRLEGPSAPLALVERCAGCHPAERDTWSLSAHAHASFDNPWYLSSVEALRQGQLGAQQGRIASRHCGGCHDPVLLAMGRMDDPISPTEPLARLGVTCLACHGARAVRPDGNASLDLVTSDLVYPDNGDEETIAKHRAQVMPEVLRSGQVCGACHRGFLGPETGNRNHLIGMDDQGSWRGSSFASADSAVLLPSAPERATCVDCHSQDHQAPGAHTPLAAALHALPAVVARLSGAVTVDVGALWIGGDLVPPESSPELAHVDAFDVVVWNTRTGHAFPGGTHDLQDTWLEVRVFDEVGALIASSGEDASDPDAARLYALVMDERGEAVRTHHTEEIVTAAFDRTIPPSQASAMRFVMPEHSPAPARIEVALQHRRHPPLMAAAACAATAEGTLDGCLEQPTTLIDSRVVALGTGEPSLSRAFAHALALSNDVQEQLDDARPSASRVDALASTPLEHASARWLLARIESRQGRRSEALAQLDAAEQLIGPHPALLRVRGEAAAAVWDWPAARDAFSALAIRSPDTAAWRDLARARGSLGDDEGALDAASAGLAMQPRDPDLLRSQALALAALDHPLAQAAEEAWLAARPPDDAAELKLLCDASVPGCARDRLPVSVYRLTSR